MKKEKRDILNKLSDWQEKNTRFYEQKTELEKQILEIDLEIWHLGMEYDKLCRDLLT